MIKYILSALFLIPTTLFSQQFSKVELGAPVTGGGDSRAVNWIDYDIDGDLDLFITNSLQAGQNNFFYENNGDGSFTEITSLSITKDNNPSDGSTWGDFNNDGYPDLFVANWYDVNNLLYLNDGKKGFTLLDDISSKDKGYSESGSMVDINNDGFLDLTVANSAGELLNYVYINNKQSGFSRSTISQIANDIAPSRHMDWADYDNDGHIDLFVAKWKW